MRSLLADTLPKTLLTGCVILQLVLAGCGGENVAEVPDASAESPTPAEFPVAEPLTLARMLSRGSVSGSEIVNAAGAGTSVEASGTSATLSPPHPANNSGRVMAPASRVLEGVLASSERMEKRFLIDRRVEMLAAGCVIVPIWVSAQPSRQSSTNLPKCVPKRICSWASSTSARG